MGRFTDLKKDNQVNTVFLTTNSNLCFQVSQQVNYAKEMFEERRYTLLRSSSNFMDE